MRIYSFVQNHFELEPVEIEISLAPGVPTFQVTGLPDTVIRESLLRIKAALRSQGFDLPRAEQVLIHLRPSHIKKSSRGLDLAMAALYLWHTEQVARPADLGERLFVYGELTLDGKVIVPEDFCYLEDLPEGSTVLTGFGATNGVAHCAVKELKDLGEPKSIPAGAPLTVPSAPELPPLRFSSETAELIAVLAAGEHHALLCGPQGSGKTTVAEAVGLCLATPSPAEWRKIARIGNMFGETERTWRPIVNPHHTATALALLGGGIPPVPGELTRASGGLLIMDEFLEFSDAVRESLREPMEKQVISVARKGERVTFPADFICVGTTNLCPCGQFVPNRRRSCSYNLYRCKSHLERLSGPLADRFDVIVYFNQQASLGEVTLSEIRVQVAAAREFGRARGLGEDGSSGGTNGSGGGNNGSGAGGSGRLEKPNGRMSLAELERWVEKCTFKNLRTSATSRRREIAELRVARTIADLQGEPLVLPRHLNQAALYTRVPFEELRKSFL